MSFESPSPALPPGQFVCRTLGPLGHGGLGFVEAVVVTESACCHPVGTQLARKKLHPRWSSDPDARARFDREIGLLSKLSHPNIVTVEGVSLPGAEKAYFMPLFPSTLRRALSSGRRFSLPEALQLAVLLADALAYAHETGFLHRDLKPDNVLLDAGENPVLCDWGLGQFVHQHSVVLDLTKAGLGTMHYCAPEQWQNGRVDARADIYSLGVTLAELVGYDPRQSPPGIGILGNVLTGATEAERLLNAFIKNMTQLRCELRPASMRAVSTHLGVIQSIA